MRIAKHLLILCFILLANLNAISLHAISEKYLPFRKNDPASYVKGVSVIDGGFSAVETDFVIIGPDPLVLRRFYDSADKLEATNFGGWRIFPQCFLAFGQSSDGKKCAVTGDHLGGFLTYIGKDEDPLKIDMANDGVGIVNTYAGEMSGQTNHGNDCLRRKGDIFELLLGDGTKRIYQKTKDMPDELFGGKIPAILSDKLLDLSYFQLVSEQHPSGNRVLFTEVDPMGWTTF